MDCTDTETETINESIMGGDGVVSAMGDDPDQVLREDLLEELGRLQAELGRLRRLLAPTAPVEGPDGPRAEARAALLEALARQVEDQVEA